MHFKYFRAIKWPWQAYECGDPGFPVVNKYELIIYS